jgi:hypothetical protein
MKVVSFYVNDQFKHSAIVRTNKEIRAKIDNWLKLYPKGKHLIYYTIRLH